MRARSSLRFYSLIVRVHRILQRMIDVTLEDFSSAGAEAGLEEGAKGDDPVERLHSTYSRVVADIVSPQLYALDRACVRFSTGIVAMISAVIIWAAFWFSLEYRLLSIVDGGPDVIGAAIAAASSALNSTSQHALDDGSSVYRICVYVVVFLYLAVLVSLVLGFFSVSYLLSASYDLVRDVHPNSAAALVETMQRDFADTGDDSYAPPFTELPGAAVKNYESDRRSKTSQLTTSVLYEARSRRTWRGGGKRASTISVKR